MLHAVAALWLAAAPGRLPAQSPWHTSGPAYPVVEAIALVPGDDAVIYAAARDPESSTSGLFRSGDGGLTWTLLAPAPDQASVRQVAIDPTATQRMAVTTHGMRFDFLYRSDDGGISWVQTRLFLSGDTRIPFFDSVDEDTLYLFGGGQIERSLSGGAWEDIGSAHSAWVSPSGQLFWTDTIPPYPYCNPFFHCGPEDVTWMSRAQGRFPVLVGGGVCLDAGTAVYSPSDASMAYAEGCGVLLSSSDGGVSWAPVSSGALTELLQSIPGGRVARIAVDPLDPVSIFLTVIASEPADGLLLKSDDGGVHWTGVPIPAPPTGPLAIGPTSRVLFVGTTQGVFRLPLGRTRTLPRR